MNTDEQMCERHAFVMERLSELVCTLAEQAHKRAMRASDPEEQDRAALVFDRLARGVRLTIALEAKMARDRRRDAAEIAAIPKQPGLPKPGPRPARAYVPTEADTEEEADVEVDDAPQHIQNLRRLVLDEAATLDPDGAHAEALSRYAAWWAEGQKYEPGADEPEPRRTRRSARPRDAASDPPWRSSA